MVQIKSNQTRKHGQSNRHAYPRLLDSPVTLTFDLYRVGPYMCTNFGVDGSSRFPFRARTYKQIDATERPTQADGFAAGMGNKALIEVD